MSYIVFAGTDAVNFRLIQAHSVLFPSCVLDQSVRVLDCVCDLCACVIVWEGWTCYLLSEGM